MKPLIARYAAAHALPEKSVLDVEYDPGVESMVVAGTSNLAINVEHLRIDLSGGGSTITQAHGDPTRDEPTDR